MLLPPYLSRRFAMLAFAVTGDPFTGDPGCWLATRPPFKNKPPLPQP